MFPESPPKQLQLRTRMALRVVSVELIPLGRMGREFKDLAAIDRHHNTPAPVMKLGFPGVAFEACIRIPARRTRGVVRSTTGRHESAETAASKGRTAGPRDCLRVLSDSLEHGIAP
jgi:hypothetical protein